MRFVFRLHDTWLIADRRGKHGSISIADIGRFGRIHSTLVWPSDGIRCPVSTRSLLVVNTCLLSNLAAPTHLSRNVSQSLRDDLNWSLWVLLYGSNKEPIKETLPAEATKIGPNGTGKASAMEEDGLDDTPGISY
jgi:hypothetical protein